ncbi:solute carrier family 25 member 35-like [Arctopsyche grandis]|uniref:solute carrier family 25 member 35-like n=1 Tax=Arctopsyche grandis TaxID=121162 RepID=UPI00406D881C
MDYLIGGLAGVGAGFFSNPFDVIKTRMQLQGELKARGQHAIHYKNVVHAVYAVVKADGLTALQKGIVPALWFQLVVNGTRLGIYQTADNRGLIRNEKGATSVSKSIFYGALAGAAGALVGSPFLLIKTQLMSYSHISIAVGYQHGHNSTFKALKQIYNKQGLKGLWRGSVSTMLRNSIGSSSQIVTFSRLVRSEHRKPKL